MKLVIELNGEETVLSMDDAKKLWRELDVIFKKETLTYPQSTRTIGGIYYGSPIDCGFNLDTTMTRIVS